MKIFVTGATGYIGSAVVEALVKAGHQVGGLHRTNEQEAAVRALGAVPIFGHLEDPARYQHFAAECDAVIHAGFASPDVERGVVEHLVGALKAEGERKTLLVTSGVLVLGETGDHVTDESGSTDRPFAGVEWRVAIERHVVDSADANLHTAVIRPGFVYGPGRKSVLGGYLKSARDEGAARYIGEGKNRMAYVQRQDLAQAYRLIVEKGLSGLFNATDHSSVTTAELAVAVSRAVGKEGKTQGVSLDQARQHAGIWAEPFAMEQRVSSPRLRAAGWAPKSENILDAVALEAR